jgi:hypothetical protein
MKQQLISIKRLVLATGMFVMLGMSTLALADSITINYKDANGVDQTLVIDGNSSDADLTLAASLIEGGGVTVTSTITESTADASLATLAASISSKASSPDNAMAICDNVATSNPTAASKIKEACNAELPSKKMNPGTGGGKPTTTPPPYVPVTSPNRP